ncbi:MAG: hypothetical protein Q4D76_19605 [Oscillospiraceae bacterium]|nr:hypothetical protein [Oscillospiraceae bacterium]
MKNFKMTFAIVLILILISLFVFLCIRNYNKVYNPTKGMTSLKTIEFYFDIKIPDEKLIKEEYVKSGRVAYKIDISTLTDLSVNLLAKGYEEYQYEKYNSDDGENPFDGLEGVDWWHLSKDKVKKSFDRLDSPKRNIGARTATYQLFITNENDKEYMYMLYLD